MSKPDEIWAVAEYDPVTGEYRFGGWKARCQGGLTFRFSSYPHGHFEVTVLEMEAYHTTGRYPGKWPPGLVQAVRAVHNKMKMTEAAAAPRPPDENGHMLQYALVTLDALVVEDTHAKDDRQLYREAAALYPEAGIEDGIKYPVRRMNYCPACKEYTAHNNIINLTRANRCPAVAALFPKSPEEEISLVKMEPGFDTGPAKTPLLTFTEKPVRRPTVPELIKESLEKWMETVSKWPAGPPDSPTEPVRPPAPSLEKEIQKAAKTRRPDDDY